MEIGNDVKASLSIYMQTIDVNGFTTTLKNTTVPLNTLQDPTGVNIFHDISDCVVKESYLLEYLEILSTEFQDRYFDDSKDLIRSMLNQHAGRDKLTPLMSAVKHNRKKLLKEMVALGGDFWRKDVNGHNIVHLAAMCGFEGILAYLCFVLKMSYTEKDNNNRTPLHLACLESQVGTGMLLIVWNEEIDLQDIEGFTPLHLAVLSQCYKLVRNLVIMRADTKIKDNKGEAPLDIALMRGDNSIVKLLVINIKEPKTCLEKINPFKQPVGPVTNGYSKTVVFVLFSLFRAAVISFIVLPRVNFYLAVGSIGLFAIAFLGFVLASCKDPGYTKNTKNVKLSEFFDMYRSEYICVYCEKRKPKHTRHCHYCKRCVKEFDHHCPWIHNCVGRDNHFWFMVFVSFSILDYSSQIALAVFDFLGMFQGNNRFFYELPQESQYVLLGVAGLSGVFLVFVFPVWMIQILNCINAPSKADRNTVVRQNSTSLADMSDTGSMLLRPSSDWNPTSFQNQASFLNTRQSTKQSGCCYTKRNEDSMGVSLKKK